jgi:hypothetical protein
MLLLSPFYLPYLNEHSKTVLFESLKLAEKNSTNDISEKCDEKILFIPSYYFGPLTLIIDLLLIAHLKKQGMRIIVVSPTRLFKGHDPLFGGNYGGFRRAKVFRHHLIERRLATRSGCEFISLRTNRTIERKIEELDPLSFVELKKFRYRGFPFGEEAWKTFLNLRDSQVKKVDEHLKLEIHAHLANQIRYLESFHSFLENENVKTLVSNSPFYYRWSIPHFLLDSKGIRTFSYILAEKINSIFVTSKHEPILSLDSDEVEKILDEFAETLEEPYEVLRSRYFELRSGVGYSNLSISKLSSEESSGILQYINQERWKKRVLVPCNVAFDAAVLHGSDAFHSYDEFLQFCLETSKDFTETLFIFKIHPAERIFKRSITSSLDIIKSNINSLNENILIVGSDVKMFAPEIIEKIDLLVAYTSSMAVEASALGKTVVTCSYSHYGSLAHMRPIKYKKDLYKKIEQVNKNELKAQSVNSRISTLYALFHFSVAQIDLDLFSNPNPDLNAQILPSVDSSIILEHKVLQGLISKVINRDRIHSSGTFLKPSGIGRDLFGVH